MTRAIQRMLQPTERFGCSIRFTTIAPLQALVAARLRRLVGILASGGLLNATEIAAQPARVRSTATTPCAGCRLQVDSVTTLGGSEQEGASFDRIPNHAVVTPDRQIVVVGNTLPAVFDFNGRLVRSIGRRGSGPGEFSRIASRVLLAPNGDLHFVVQSSLILVFRRDGAFVRQVRLARTAQNPVLLSDGRVAALFPWFRFIPNTQTVDQPLLHLFDATGVALRTIGQGITAGDGGVAAGLDGTMWTWKRSPFSLRHWDANGTLIGTLDRIIPNFDARPFRHEGPVLFGQPRILDVRQAQDGLLWVSYVDQPPPPFCKAPLERCWGSTVEVIDPANGLLIASARVPMQASMFVGDGYVASITYTAFTMDTEEPVTLTLYSAKLVRPAARRMER